MTAPPFTEGSAMSTGSANLRLAVIWKLTSHERIRQWLAIYSYHANVHANLNLWRRRILALHRIDGGSSLRWRLIHTFHYSLSTSVGESGIRWVVSVRHWPVRKSQRRASV